MSKKITEIFAYIITDENGNECFISFEGVGSLKSPDWGRAIGFRPLADTISDQLNRTYKLIRFALAEEIKLEGGPYVIQGMEFRREGG